MWCVKFSCFLWIILYKPAISPDTDSCIISTHPWHSFPDFEPSIFVDPLHFLTSDTELCTRNGTVGIMASVRRCCVPNCNVTREDNITLHTFPNPEKEPDRFRDWIYAVKGEILALDNQVIFKKRKVCHRHFDSKYHTWTKTLSHNAVPTLHLPEIFPSPKVLQDVTNKISKHNVEHPEPEAGSTSHQKCHEPMDVSTSEIYPPPKVLQDITSSKHNVENLEPQAGPTSHQKCHEPMEISSSGTLQQNAASHTITLKKRAAEKKGHSEDHNINYLRKLVKKLTQKKDNYSTRLKKALKLSENETFQKCLKKFTSLAALFTIMQFRESGKNKNARRFTQEEKVMALSLYKQGPRAYRWLSKVFVLPSPLTLSRIISRAGIKPGLNEKILSQLKKRAEKMAEHEKLCVLLFDEVKLSPNFQYSRKKDKISGFATNGTEIKRTIATHALVFMLRGVISNYKQPIAYTFCTNTTPAEELKNLIKKIIVGVHGCGLKILATVCDQGSTNVSAINKLIDETRREYLRNNKEFLNETFEVDGKEIVPLFDTPHLIKGVRNNLLTKNLKCTISGVEKIAKWHHLILLFEENPAYKGIRLVKNLTEGHVIPQKINKMKVKYATQVFSRTVAVNMGYLAGKGILPQECTETADVLLFFDELFDSLNGSYENSKKRTGKDLLSSVTPNSQHWEVWTNSKKVLRSMKFITNDGGEVSIPSIRNWIRTIDNVQYLIKKIFYEHNFKSVWMRHFNQDPLENFFGAIRCHGMRNVSPSPSAFEAAFASLLVTNIANHSPGSNCEQDFCKSFVSLKSLFDNEDQEDLNENVEVDFEDLQCELINYEVKKQDPRIIGQLSYVSGFVLRQTKKKIFKNCAICKQTLIGKREDNEYLNKRNYERGCLTYPSESLKNIFSQMQDVICHILEKKSHRKQLINYCKTVILINSDFNFLQCKKHKNDIVKFILDLTCRFFIFNWCRDVNKILNGTRTEHNINDYVKKMALDYHIKQKNKK